MSTTKNYSPQQLLTPAQQAIIDAYQREIVREHKLLQEAVAAFDAGHGSHAEISYHDRQLGILTTERRETLAHFVKSQAVS